MPAVPDLLVDTNRFVLDPAAALVPAGQDPDDTPLNPYVKSSFGPVVRAANDAVDRFAVVSYPYVHTAAFDAAVEILSVPVNTRPARDLDTVDVYAMASSTIAATIS